LSHSNNKGQEPKWANPKSNTGDKQLKKVVYSGTSLKALSKLRTQLVQKNLRSYWGRVLQFQANTFLPLKEENLYMTAKMTQKWLVPKCPLLRGSTVHMNFRPNF